MTFTDDVGVTLSLVTRPERIVADDTAGTPWRAWASSPTRIFAGLARPTASAPPAST
ncbi:MAG: hypothetical protein ACR2GH_21330 [Pseudonocardia sp.]